MKKLSEIPGIEAPYFNSPHFKEFVVDLLKTKGILTVNGSGFGKYGEDHFRIVYLAQENVLNKAFDKIEDFMQEKY